MGTINLELMQNELKYAFKWIEQATQDMKKGETTSAVFCMTVAMQHWVKVQHNHDKYISDEEAEKIHWDFFTTKAMAMAKEELAKEELAKEGE